MADRYTYIPLIGVFIMIAWGVPEALGGWRFRPHLLAGTAAAAIVALGAVSARQAGYWRSSSALFEHAMKVSIEQESDNWLVHYNLGVALQKEGRIGEAEHHFRETLRIHPGYGKAHNNLGFILHKKGRIGEAVAHYRMAVRVDPGNVEAHFNLGSALIYLGKNGEAADEFREVLRLDPRNGTAEHYLKVLSSRAGS
jgi:tetratricopeptide (TPR) repeat protein